MFLDNREYNDKAGKQKDRRNLQTKPKFYSKKRKLIIQLKIQMCGMRVSVCICVCVSNDTRILSLTQEEGYIKILPHRKATAAVIRFG